MLIYTLYNGISRTHLVPYKILKGDELKKFRKVSGLPTINLLYLLDYKNICDIVKHFKTNFNFKEYFEIVETVSSKENNVKILERCIELYDMLIDMNINKIYEMKKELFNNKTYPQHIKKIIFNVFQTVELKKLNIWLSKKLFRVSFLL